MRTLFLSIAVMFFVARAGATAPDDISLRARSFAEQLATRKFGALMPLLDSTMTSVMSVEKFSQMWDGILEKAGAFKRITSTRQDSAPPYDVVFVTCVFEKGDFNLKVVYNRKHEVAGLFVVPNRPAESYVSPAYAVADSFRAKLVTVGEAPWLLHGTLTVPRREGRFPAIVLVHGSGPNDRDETIGPNKPFRDLAEGLSSRGVVVLRYEKRTREHASRMFEVKDNITVKEEVLDDALAAVKLLRGRDEVDPHRVFVLGHSLGGTLAPRIGAADTTIAGLIMMAGATRPLEDAYLEQLTYLAGSDTAKSDSVRSLLARVRGQVAQVKSPSLASSTPTSFLPMGVPASYWLDMRGYHAADVAASLHCPMLILQGKRDYQVTLVDFDGWKRALNGHANAMFKVYPALNHLFLAGKGKSGPAEYDRAGHIPVEVVNDIAEWVKRK